MRNIAQNATKSNRKAMTSTVRSTFFFHSFFLLFFPSLFLSFFVSLCFSRFERWCDMIHISWKRVDAAANNFNRKNMKSNAKLLTSFFIFFIAQIGHCDNTMSCLMTKTTFDAVNVCTFLFFFFFYTANRQICRRLWTNGTILRTILTSYTHRIRLENKIERKFNA